MPRGTRDMMPGSTGTLPMCGDQIGHRIIMPPQVIIFKGHNQKKL
jgi:hypothetical protein